MIIQAQGLNFNLQKHLKSLVIYKTSSGLHTYCIFPEEMISKLERYQRKSRGSF